MNLNSFSKHITIPLLGLSLAILLVFFIGFIPHIIPYQLLSLIVESHDKKQDREWAEHSYQEHVRIYQQGSLITMTHIYDFQHGIGFYSGGGFTSQDCFEEYIRETWSDKQVAFISFCKDDGVADEKSAQIQNFWKQYKEIFNVQ